MQFAYTGQSCYDQADAAKVALEIPLRNISSGKPRTLLGEKARTDAKLPHLDMNGHYPLAKIKGSTGISRSCCSSTALLSQESANKMTDLLDSPMEPVLEDIPLTQFVEMMKNGEIRREDDPWPKNFIL